MFYSILTSNCAHLYTHKFVFGIDLKQIMQQGYVKVMNCPSILSYRAMIGLPSLFISLSSNVKVFYSGCLTSFLVYRENNRKLSEQQCQPADSLWVS
jgi:hypothetical protein